MPIPRPTRPCRPCRPASPPWPSGTSSPGATWSTAPPPCAPAARRRGWSWPRRRASPASASWWRPDRRIRRSESIDRRPKADTSPLSGGRRALRLGVEDPLGDLGQGQLAVHGGAAHARVGLVLGEAELLHEPSLGPLDHLAGGQLGLQALRPRAGGPVVGV